MPRTSSTASTLPVEPTLATAAFVPVAIALIWFTTRPTTCTLCLNTPGGQRIEGAAADGRRHAVRLTGLAPGGAYAYEVRAGRRVLTPKLGEPDELRFQTNHRPGERFSFIVFGDSGRGSRQQYELAREMNAVLPSADFLLHTGDMVYPDGARERYEARFFAPYHALLARVNFWPCVGNHDLDRRQALGALLSVPVARNPSLTPERTCPMARSAVLRIDSTPRFTRSRPCS